MAIITKQISIENLKKKPEYLLTSKEKRRLIYHEKENENISLSLYACLNKSQYNKVASGEYEIEVPEGVEVKFKRRGLYFECANKKLAKMLTEALDDDGINWTAI